MTEPGETTYWMDRPVLGLDLESTGLDTENDRPVSVALAWVEPNGKARDRKTYLVDPDMVIADEAIAVHGITNAQARHGTHWSEMVVYLGRVLNKTHRRGEPVVIMNARFDWTMLHHLAKRIEVQLPPIAILDPVPIDRALDKYRSGSRKLTDLAKHYGLEDFAAHTASADALTATQVMYAMARRYPDALRRSLPELMAWQAKVFEEWRAGLVLHWKEIGKEVTNPPRPGWPLEDPLTL